MLHEPTTSDDGAALHQFAAELFPWHRSITGSGLRRTLEAIQQHIPMRIESVVAGTRVFGWEVPEEWTIRDAFVSDDTGQRVIDYRESNLHVVNYSQPVDCQLSWDDLRSHLFTLPEHPDWIPYRTAYFQQRWGFCLSHRQYEYLAARGNQRYRVCIDAEFSRGCLNYGEYVLPGRRREELLLSIHVCHPSLANDNLSSIAVATELACQLSLTSQRELGVRFLFIPATIGAITWLSLNRHTTDRILGGLVLANLGDTGAFTYKLSRHGDALIDESVPSALRDLGLPCRVREFDPFGYDERQYCSPGFNLPVGRLTRTPNGEYPEYHTSADNLDLIQPRSLAESLAACRSIIDQMERHVAENPISRPVVTTQRETVSCTQISLDQPIMPTIPEPATKEALGALESLINTHPYCEPPLGRFDMYYGFGQVGDQQLHQAVMWLLNLCDGQHTTTDVARRSGLSVAIVHEAVRRLIACGLLCPIVDRLKVGDDTSASHL